MKPETRWYSNCCHARMYDSDKVCPHCLEPCVEIDDAEYRAQVLEQLAADKENEQRINDE